MKLKHFNCNLCKSKDLKTIHPSTIPKTDSTKFSIACTSAGHGEYYQLVKCNQCRLYFSSPRPGAADLVSEYSKLSDDIYKQELAGRIRTFQKSLNNLLKYKSNGSLLDVGCSIGVFLSEAKKKGFKVFGIEPSSWAVKKAKTLFKLSIKQGTYKQVSKFNQKFDVVTLWDVIEHVDDPLDMLKKCKSVLKPNGVLAFSTVDIGSFYAKLMGKKWPWLMRMHIYYFDKQSIRLYLKKAGLELISLKKYHHIVSLNYLLYKLKKINSFLYFLALLTKKTILLNKNIYITFGLGDFMEVYAKKT